jgi:selenocysteine-specific elongation factor
VGVIGTAGHVDHGKSSLVRALTGIDPDRLREEKEREMTIDLGFAWLDLPGGERVGIIDVPGHKDFIKNMLAGVGGIDAALFVVAADEGVMPQTQEHLDILDLLQVKTGVIALTKIDLVSDPEWLELMEADLLEHLEGTPLEHAPVVHVSARTGAGLDKLKAAIAAALRSAETRQDRGRARLPVDRIFTIAGFGAVVTGTLMDGVLRVGDEIELQPAGLKGRIRGIQSHKDRLERAYPGSRVAVNLTGIGIEHIARGDVVAAPGVLRGTTMVDASLRFLSDAPIPLKHGTAVDFFSGAAEAPARLRLLDKEILQPGETAWVQFQLETPIAILKGDRYIIRLPSPSVTIGGGIVVDPHPSRRHRRMRPDVVERLKTLAYGTPAELLVQALQKGEPCTLEDLRGRVALVADALQEALSEALTQGDILPLTAGETADGWLPPSTLVISRAGWARLTEQIERLLSDYHSQYPLRRGMPREELKSRLRLAGRVFNQIVEYAGRAGLLREIEGYVARPDHAVVFSAEQQARVARMLAEFRRQPYTPPSIPDAEKLLDAELLNACFEQGLLLKVSEDVAFLPETYQTMLEQVKAHLRQHGTITVAQVRDQFGASRRYALALMGYLDQQGVTRRMGDERVLR